MAQPITTMTEPPATLEALLRLQTWLSPAFPTGSFAYSHGLETVISSGEIKTREDLNGWLIAMLKLGSAKTDAILFQECWNAAQNNDKNRISDLNELALALQPSCERFEETTSQAVAFLEAVKFWPVEKSATAVGLSGDIALPIAVSTICAIHDIPLLLALSAYLNATISNLVWISVRLIPLGQSDGLSLIAGLETSVQELAQYACNHSIEDIGSSALAFDIASQNHEFLQTRIFKS